jgi:hypothetical protein
MRAKGWKEKRRKKTSKLFSGKLVRKEKLTTFAPRLTTENTETNECQAKGAKVKR